MFYLWNFDSLHVTGALPDSEDQDQIASDLQSWSIFTNHSQEHSLSFSPRLVNLNVAQLLIG